MTLEEMERAYLSEAGGDARDALRRALADAMAEIESVSRQVSRGYVRAVGSDQRSINQAAAIPAAVSASAPRRSQA